VKQTEAEVALRHSVPSQQYTTTQEACFVPESDWLHCFSHSAAEPVHEVPLLHETYTSAFPSDVPPQPASSPAAISPAMIALRIL
jgi:hypothetical protein